MADGISIRSTSATSAVAGDVVLRDGKRVQLVFRPQLVGNERSPEAGVKGSFIYLKRGASEEWAEVERLSFGKLKRDEGYSLELHSEEALKLFRSLADLYEVHRQHGVPQGAKTFIPLDRQLADLAKIPANELRKILQANSTLGPRLIEGLLAWASDSEDPAGLIGELLRLPPDFLRNLNLAVSVKRLRAAVETWEENRENADEEFWQEALTKDSFLLEQLFFFPVTIVESKAFMGGKRVDNKGGKLVDFLIKNEITRDAGLVEIKTPATPLLGKAYRDGIFPLSQEVAGGVAQVLVYKRTLVENWDRIQPSGRKFAAFDPRCVVVVGNAGEQLRTPARRMSFELVR